MAIHDGMENAYVTLTRGTSAYLSNVRAFVKAPGKENISPEGVIVSTTVLLDPLPTGISIKAGDSMTFLSLGGHSAVGQIPKRNILSAPFAPVAAEFADLAVVRVYLEGTLQ